MAVRFVDFGRQLGDGPRRFGFWYDDPANAPTSTGFLEYNGEQSWIRYEDFERDLIEDLVAEGCTLDQGTAVVQSYQPLCPAWVFGDTAPPEDIPDLLRLASDIVKVTGEEAIGQAVFEAGAEVERLQALTNSMKAMFPVNVAARNGDNRQFMGGIFRRMWEEENQGSPVPRP